MKEKLLELMKERWTVRKFKDKEVSEEDLQMIIEAGRWAPSGGNRQPWELIVVRDEETRFQIAEIFSDAMGLKSRSERYVSPPVLIAVCVDKRVIQSYPDGMPAEFVVYASIGAMVQNMMLMATELGLGLSWGTQPQSVRDQLKDLLDIPDHLEIPDILQLGYPGQDSHLSKRRDPDDFVHEDRIDVDKLRDDIG